MASIQGIYLAFFGRPADPAGLAYWEEQTNGGADLSVMLNALAYTDEYQDRFTGMSNAEIITSIYEMLFGRAPEAEGLAFFIEALESGAQTLGSIAVNVLDGAQGSDLAMIENKIEAADLFTASLDTPEEIAAYDGNDAAEFGRQFLSTVTDDPETVPTADAVQEQINTDMPDYTPDEGQVPGGTTPGGTTPDPYADLIAEFNAAEGGVALVALIHEYAETLGVEFTLTGGRGGAVGNGVEEVRDLFGDFTSLDEIKIAVANHITAETGKKDAVAGLYASDLTSDQFRDLVMELNQGRADIIDYYNGLLSANPSDAAAQRVDDLEDELYTLSLQGVVTDASNVGWDNLHAEFVDNARDPYTGSVVNLVNDIYEAHAGVNDDVAAMRALNLAKTGNEVVMILKENVDNFGNVLEAAALSSGRTGAVGSGVLEYIDLYGAFIDIDAVKDVILLHVETEKHKADFISAVGAANDETIANVLDKGVTELHDDRQSLITDFNTSGDPDAVARASELAVDTYTMVLNTIIEPHQVFRRPFGLSYAAMAGASSMA